MEKLVRDKMPELCSNTPGWTPMTYRVATKREMRTLLLAKLAEEIGEVTHSVFLGSKDELVEELADVQEVLKAFQAVFEITSEEVELARQNKHAQRGGFKNGIVWDGKK